MLIQNWIAKILTYKQEFWKWPLHAYSRLSIVSLSDGMFTVLYLSSSIPGLLDYWKNLRLQPSMAGNGNMEIHSGQSTLHTGYFLIVFSFSLLRKERTGWGKSRQKHRKKMGSCTKLLAWLTLEIRSLFYFT